MQTATIEMSRYEARRAYLRYRQAVRERKKAATDAERQQIAEDEALRRGYLELARGHKVLDLVATMRLGGVIPDGHPFSQMPKLAIARADARRVTCSRFTATTNFSADVRGRGRKHCVFRFDGTVLPRLRLPQDAWSISASALVPMVPASLRPAGSLAEYCILWEAVWEPVPPVDPMLLKPLGCNLYAVVAVWDLTDLERAVINARLSG